MTDVTAFHDLMPDSITREAFTGKSTDGLGTPTYGGPIVFANCRVEMGISMLTATELRNKRVIGKVFVATTTVFDERDRITLPSDFVPNQPPIVQVRPERDEDGIHHIILLLGMMTTSSGGGA